MNVLVTGAGGFIGSHLTDALLEAGHSVRALVRYNSRNDAGHLKRADASLPSRLSIEAGDVTDPALVNKLVRDCDIVFHLAALIGIPYSYHAPWSYLSTNATGTLNILEASRQARVKRVIVTSTSEVYGTALYTPIDESHPLQAQSPYAASKIAADKLAESYFRSFGLPVVILRPFNTYGPRQSARAVIPSVLSQGLAGKAEIQLGNLSPRRDWVYVDDTVRAFLLAMEAPGIQGETIHFGTGRAVSVGEAARMCLDLLGGSSRLATRDDRKRPESSEVDLLLCDPGKAHRELRWSPQVGIEEGLLRTADYIRSNLSMYSVDNYVL